MQKFQDDTADFAGSATGGGLTSTLYTVLTAGFFAAGVGYLYAPEFTLQVTSEDQVIARSPMLAEYSQRKWLPWPLLSTIPVQVMLNMRC